MVVHTHEHASDLEVFPGVYFTTDKSKIEWLMQHNEDAVIKFFVGYAGWAPGQLDGELEQEAWIVAEADPEDPFRTGDIWSGALQRKGGRYRLMATMPADPSLN
jgi:putative AlgH/UPF0301 family transcriptional regulator